MARVTADGLLLEGWRAHRRRRGGLDHRLPGAPLAREAGLAVGENGRMLVDGTMRSVSHPEVYGIGDAPPRKRDGQELRMGCGPGGLTAVVAVRAIGDRLAGHPPRSLRVEGDGLCISLGRKDGLLQRIDRDGNPQGRVLTGPPGRDGQGGRPPWLHVRPAQPHLHLRRRQPADLNRAPQSPSAPTPASSPAGVPSTILDSPSSVAMKGLSRLRISWDWPSRSGSYHPRLGEGYVQTWYQERRGPARGPGARGPASPMTAYRTAYGASARPRAEYVTGAWVEPEAVLAGKAPDGRARRGSGRSSAGHWPASSGRISRARRGGAGPQSEGHDLQALTLPGRRPKKSLLARLLTPLRVVLESL